MEDTIPVQDIAAHIYQQDTQAVGKLVAELTTVSNENRRLRKKIERLEAAPIIVVLATAQTGPDRKPAADQPNVTQAAAIAAPATWDAHEPTDAPEAPQEARETPEPEF